MLFLALMMLAPNRACKLERALLVCWPRLMHVGTRRASIGAVLLQNSSVGSRACIGLVGLMLVSSNSTAGSASDPSPDITCAASPATKIVHFVRHGEGYHNIGHDELEDSPLTQRGWADAHALHAHLDALEALGRPMSIDVRAMHAASIHHDTNLGGTAGSRFATHAHAGDCLRGLWGPVC